MVFGAAETILTDTELYAGDDGTEGAEGEANYSSELSTWVAYIFLQQQDNWENIRLSPAFRWSSPSRTALGGMAPTRL